MARRRARAPAPLSELEETLALHIRAWCLPAPQREFLFHVERKWRFDFAWPDRLVAAECEGLDRRGLSRHQHIAGYLADLDKYNAAAMLGWRVLRFARPHIDSGIAVALLEDALGG